METLGRTHLREQTQANQRIKQFIEYVVCFDRAAYTIIGVLIIRCRTYVRSQFFYQLVSGAFVGEHTLLMMKALCPPSRHIDITRPVYQLQIYGIEKLSSCCFFL